MRRNAKGIFCIEEEDWWLDPKRPATLAPMLELLRQHPYGVPSIRRDVGTKEEFQFYLRKWTQKRFRTYPILYLAMHGDPGCVYIGDRRKGAVSLDEIQDVLRNACRGRVIYFGSCATLNIEKRRLRAFLKDTRATALFGYDEDVDWLEAGGFELLIFSSLQQISLTTRGLGTLKSRIKNQLQSLARSLDFRMQIRSTR